MHRRLRMNVFEADNGLIFINDPGRELLTDDPAKKTVGRHPGIGFE
jgi:hypothetical protein